METQLDARDAAGNGGLVEDGVRMLVKSIGSCKAESIARRDYKLFIRFGQRTTVINWASFYDTTWALNFESHGRYVPACANVLLRAKAKSY